MRFQCPSRRRRHNDHAGVDTVFRDLADESTISDIRARLRAFFDRALRLPTHCVVDVVIERRSTYLVDVNVAAQRTDPLLFEWADVLALRRTATGPRPPSETFELRVVEASDAVRASALSSFRAPLDVAAIADAGGLDELVRRSRLDDSSSSSSASSSSYGGVD